MAKKSKKKTAAKKTTKKKTSKTSSKKSSAKKKKSAKKSKKALATTTEKDDTPVVLAEIVENGSSNNLPAISSGTLTPLGDGLSTYLANVNKYPLLSKDQEKEIAERYYEQRDPRDAEILVTANLRFVVKIAAEYARFGNKLIDVIQEGNVGLMHAVKEFNPYKGVRLITYAVWWIRGYIQEYLMKQHSMVRIGTTQNQRKLFYNLQKEKALLDQMGEEVTTKELALRLDVPEKDVRMMEQRMAGGDISLDQPLGDNDSSMRIDLESDDDDTPLDESLALKESLNILAEKIDNLMPTLSDKEQLILQNRILSDNPATLQDIGTEWGVTREAVRQMEARLMKKIKNAMLEK